MSILGRLFRFLMPYWKTLLLSAGLLLALTFLGLVPPLFHRAIVDEVIGERNLSRLGALLGSLVGVYALQQLVDVGDSYTRTRSLPWRMAASSKWVITTSFCVAVASTASSIAVSWNWPRRGRK